MIHIEPAPSTRGQARRHLFLCLEGLNAESAERLAGMASAKESLFLKAKYEPPATEYDFGSWGFSLAFSDGTILDRAYQGLPIDGDKLPRARQGVTLEPEVVEQTVSAVEAGSRLTVIEAMLEAREPALFGKGYVRNGLVRVSLHGPAFAKWYTPRGNELPRGSHLVYAKGRILGRAAKEGGAEQAARAERYLPRKLAPKGWKLTRTSVGTLWMPRPPDDVAFRIREVRRTAETLKDQITELLRLDLSSEPDMARELAELLADLGRGELGDSVARAGNVPAPRKRPARQRQPE